MKDYYISKYDIDPDKLFVMSIMPFKNVEEIVPEKPENKIPNVIYAGGIQKWQNVNMMCDIMEQTAGQYRFIVLTPNPADFNAYWNKKRPDGVTVTSKAPEEIFEVYRDCDYGLLLRDDSVVNRVACPTKILEYIACGLLPVFKTPHIGDFLELGIHYIAYHDLLDHKLPTPEQRAQYIEENKQILKKMETEYADGIQLLRFIIQQAKEDENR